MANQEPSNPPTMPLQREEGELIRVRLAAERTLLAWIRTGLALMGFGFIVARFGMFMREFGIATDPTKPPSPGLSLWLGVALVVLGVIILLMAAAQYRQIFLNLGGSRIHKPQYTIMGLVVAVALAVVGLAMAVYLISLR